MSMTALEWLVKIDQLSADGQAFYLADQVDDRFTPVDRPLAEVFNINGVCYVAEPGWDYVLNTKHPFHQIEDPFRVQFLHSWLPEFEAWSFWKKWQKANPETSTRELCRKCLLSDVS